MKSWNDQIRDLQNSTEAVRQKAYEYITASDYYADTKEYAESIICTQDEHEYKWALTLERDLIQEALEYGYAEVKNGNAEQPNEAKAIIQNFIAKYGFRISVKELADMTYTELAMAGFKPCIVNDRYIEVDGTTYLFSKSRKHNRWIAKEI